MRHRRMSALDSYYNFERVHTGCLTRGQLPADIVCGATRAKLVEAPRAGACPAGLEAPRTCASSAARLRRRRPPHARNRARAAGGDESRPNREHLVREVEYSGVAVWQAESTASRAGALPTAASSASASSPSARWGTLLAASRTSLSPWQARWRCDARAASALRKALSAPERLRVTDPSRAEALLDLVDLRLGGVEVAGRVGECHEPLRSGRPLSGPRQAGAVDKRGGRVAHVETVQEACRPGALNPHRCVERRERKWAARDKRDSLRTKSLQPGGAGAASRSPSHGRR